MTKDCAPRPAVHFAEILKRLGQHERDLEKHKRELVQQNDLISDPALERQIDALDEAISGHPIAFVAKWLEEHSGLSRFDVEDLARRMATGIGAQPHKKHGEPKIYDRTGALRLPVIEEWSDLRPVLAKLHELDASLAILRFTADFVESFPEISRTIGIEVAALPGSSRPDGNEANGRGREKPPKTKGTRGPIPKADEKHDQKIFDAWQTRQFKRYADLAREMKIEEYEVSTAIDRVRHRKS